MAISPWAVLNPVQYGLTQTGVWANKQMGNPAKQMVDDVFGAYGYQDVAPQQEMLNKWAAMRQQDLAQNSMSGLVGEQFDKAADEGRAAAEASAQNAADKARMYGATTGQLERAINQGGMNQLNVTADIAKQRADAMIGAKQADIAARRDIEDKAFQAGLGIEGQRLASYGRRGGLWGALS